MSKHGEMEGEVRERAVKDRSVIGSLARVKKGRSVSMEVKRRQRNSILLPTLMYGSEMLMWNRAQQSRVRAVEMNYLRGACGVTKRDGKSNESVYERCGMGSRANGVTCGVVEWVKRNTLRWFGHTDRMGNKFVKKVYMSESVGPNSRGRPLGRWRDRVKQYSNPSLIRSFIIRYPALSSTPLVSLAINLCKLNGQITKTCTLNFPWSLFCLYDQREKERGHL